MKKILFVLVLGLASAALAQTVKTLVTQNIALNLAGGDKVVISITATTMVKGKKVTATKVALDYAVPAGKSLRGRVMLSGELK